MSQVKTQMTTQLQTIQRSVYYGWLNDRSDILGLSNTRLCLLLLFFLFLCRFDHVISCAVVYTFCQHASDSMFFCCFALFGGGATCDLCALWCRVFPSPGCGCTRAAEAPVRSTAHCGVAAAAPAVCGGLAPAACTVPCEARCSSKHKGKASASCSGMCPSTSAEVSCMPRSASRAALNATPQSTT